VRKKRQVPSSRGARSFAGGKKPASGRAKSPAASRGARPAARAESGAKLLEACVRCLGKIDVLVGKAKVKAAVRLDANENLSEKLRGKVLVVETAAPEVAIRSVATQRLAGASKRPLSFFRATSTTRGSLRSARGPMVLLCSARAWSPIVAHIGGHGRGFTLVFARLGVVLDARNVSVGLTCGPSLDVRNCRKSLVTTSVKGHPG
jgi:hypothetical protein